MSSWFKRKDKGIQTPTEQKKDVKKGATLVFTIPFK